MLVASWDKGGGSATTVPIGLCRNGHLRLGLVLLRLQLFGVATASVMSLRLRLNTERTKLNFCVEFLLV